MKIFRLIAAASMLAAITALPAFAQGQQGAARPAAAGAAAQVNVPESKIAFVVTDMFDDEKQGITRLVNAAKGVQREFQPRQTEIQGMQQRVQTLTDEIAKTANVADPKTIQTKQEQLDQLKKDLQRKAEDGQAAYTKRLNEVLGPIYEDLGKALDAFAKQRGITLLLDASKIGPAILSLNDGMDVTLAFIREYNSKNPATASAAAPRD